MANPGSSLQTVRRYGILMLFIFSLIAQTAYTQSGSRRPSDTLVKLPFHKLIDSARKIKLTLRLDFRSLDTNMLVEVTSKIPFDSTIALLAPELGQKLTRYGANNLSLKPIEPGSPDIPTCTIIVSNPYLERLPRATIETSHGTYFTNDSGIAIIPLKSAQDTVDISYTGMKSETRTILTPGKMAIALQLDDRSLRPIYKTTSGYVSATPITITANRIMLSGEQLNFPTPISPQTALEGQVPGLYINPTNGIPGSISTTTLRGYNSLLNGREPTICYNHVPLVTNNQSLSNIGSGFMGMTLSPFSLLPLRTDDTIDVLKDGDATAIFGSKGANGVILIATTHSNSIQKPEINFRFSKGVTTPARLPKMLNMRQYDAMRQEALRNDSLPIDAIHAPELSNWDTTRSTNWQNIFVGGIGQTDNAQLTLSAGSHTDHWHLTVGNARETNVFPQHPANDLLSLQGDLDHNSRDHKWDLQFSGLYTHNWNHGFTTDPTRFQTFVPNAPSLTDNQGNLIFRSNGVTFDNPMAYLLQPYLASSYFMLGDTYITFQPTTAFTFRLNIGYNAVNTIEHSQIPIRSQSPYSNVSPTGSSYFASTLYSGSILEPQMEYQKTKSNFVVNMLTGLSYQPQITRITTIEGHGYMQDAELNNLALAPMINRDSEAINSNYEAIFARVTVHYKTQYILNLTNRLDGSSRLGPHEKFGDFGAIGGAWIFSDELFIRRAFRMLSFGKMRFSYGTTGNDQIGDHQLLSPTITGTVPYQNIPGYYAKSQVLSGRKWELITKMELSLEGGLWKDHLIFTFSWYRNTSRNQLLPASLPSTGPDLTFSNWPAILLNQGWEFYAAWKNIDKKHVQWVTSINYSIPVTRLIAFSTITQSIYNNSLIVGQSPLAVLGYRSTGVDPKTGIFQFQHQGPDPHPTFSDQKVIEPYRMSGFGGITNTVIYKRVEIMILIDGRKAIGNDYQSGFYASNPPGARKTFYSNETTDILDHWQKQGDRSLYQKLTTISTSDAGKAILDYLSSSAPIRNTSFIRFRKISIRYDLPRTSLQKAGLKQVQFFLNASNLLLLTPYKGLDPEITNINVFPTTRSVETGFNIIF